MGGGGGRRVRARHLLLASDVSNKNAVQRWRAGPRPQSLGGRRKKVTHADLTPVTFCDSENLRRYLLFMLYLMTCGCVIRGSQTFLT